MGRMKISSPVFGHKGTIPAKYTCDGANISPALTIEGVPDGARSLVLIVDDPDAPSGTWVHWVVWNIDPKTRQLAEGAVGAAEEGVNDFRKRDYGGPCPPSGTHRYFFKLYALDTVLHPGDGASKAAVEKSMKGHILDQAEIVGLYRRSSQAA